MARQTGDGATSRLRLLEALGLARAAGHRPLIASVVAELAWAIAEDGRALEAAVLLGAVEAARAEMGRRLVGPELADYEQRLAASRTKLGPQAANEGWGSGAQAGLESCVERMLA